MEEEEKIGIRKVEKIEKPKKEDEVEEEVLITEVSEDDKILAAEETSQAIVTQPEDKTKDFVERIEEEEELIIVEEKKSGGLKQRRRKVVEKEEVEIEIEMIEGERRKEKKVIKAKKPYVEEEIIEEETLNKLDISPAKSVKGLLLKTSAQVSECVPETSVTLVGDITTAADKGVINVIPFTAIEGQIVEGEEKEETTQGPLLPGLATAKPRIDTIEPFSVGQPHVETVASEFSGVFKPTLQEANTVLITSEGIVVSETRVNQTVTERQQSLDHTSQATVSLLLHEAKSVTETLLSVKEGEMQSAKQPTQVHADKNVVLQESLCVTEVTQGVREEKFSGIVKPTPVKPKVEFSSREPLIISEVLTEMKPGKYFPELIVPTETATRNVVAQTKTALTEEMNLPEKEGEYVPGKLPHGQYAGVGITSGDFVIVCETNIHEKESELPELKYPDFTTATEDISLSEGLLVSVVQHQDNETILNIESHETRTVDIGINQQESIILLETLAADSEGVFHADELPNARSADTMITCLETSGVSEVVVQEATGEFVPKLQPTAFFAESTIRPIESVSVIETRAEDVPGEFTQTLKYHMDEAAHKFETFEAKEVSVVHSQDSEAPIDNFVKPAAYSIEETFMPQEGISVYHTEIIEKESDYPSYILPESYKGKMVPGQPLQSVVIEETQPEGDVGTFIKCLPQEVKAKVEHTTFQETVVEQTIVTEETGKHKEKIQPEGKLAECTVLEEEGITITEVISDIKEENYVRSELPTECFATPSLTGQTVAIKSEVSPSLDAAPLQEQIPVKGIAKAEQTPLESLVITSTQIAESELELVGDIKPDTKLATIEMADKLESITVQQVVSHDKELELIPPVKPKELVASTSISAHQTAVQSETLTNLQVDVIPEVVPLTSKAKVDSIPLQEVVVTKST